jgi:hypothetical protein
VSCRRSCSAQRKFLRCLSFRSLFWRRRYSAWSGCSFGEADSLSRTRLFGRVAVDCAKASKVRKKYQHCANRGWNDTRRHDKGYTGHHRHHGRETCLFQVVTDECRIVVAVRRTCHKLGRIVRSHARRTARTNGAADQRTLSDLITVISFALDRERELAPALKS